MKRYWIKQFIKYSILAVVLVLATIFVYDRGKESYQNYLDNNKDDVTWIRDNINLIEDNKIGNGVLRADMPNNLEVSTDVYNEVISEEIDKLLINNYKIDNPLFIYDPYLNNPTTVNIYFHTGNNYKFEYYVTTETITLEEDVFYVPITDEMGMSLFTNRHFYVLEGFTLGKKNNLLIRILDENNLVIDAENFIINIPND